MPKGNETTTKFKVDISELKKSMQEARKQVAYANSEFKEASSSMDDWSKSSDGLSAKLKQLKSNLDSQETLLKEYEKALEKVKEEYGENSAEALEFATKLNNQKAVVNKIKKEISGYEDALQEVSEAEKIASKTGKDVAEVLADVGKEADDAGDGFTTLKGTIATFAGNVLTSLVGGIKDAISSFVSLADETREYREQMNKLNSASADAGYDADYAKEKYKELYGVLGDETASSTAISNFMAIGLEQGQLNNLINSATGIWAKYGDSIPLDGLAESINETAKVGQVTGNLADALNWAGVSEDEFNERLEECTNEQARQKMIVAILNKEYGDLGKSYKESNASVIEAREAQADYTDTLAQMGAKIEPVTTTLKEGFNGLLQELLKLVGDVDMEAFTAKIEEAFGVIKDDVLPAIKEGFGWILDNKDTIIASLAGIATGFLAFKVVTLIQGVASAMQGMTIAQYALNLAMSLNPIGLIVSLIAGLVVAFVTLWNKSDSFREFWINLWEKIKSGASIAIEAIGKFFTETIPNFFSGLIDWIKENWQSILLFLINPFAGLFKYFYDNNGKFKEFVDTAINFIKELPSKAWTWLVNTINKVTQWRKDMIDKAKDTALSFINKVIEYVKKLPEKIWSWLLNVVTKVNSWKSDMIDKAKNTASDFINKVIEYVKKLPTETWGWLVKVVSKVSDWGKDLVSKGKEVAGDLFDSIVNKIKELPDKIKSIGTDIVKGLWNGINNMSDWVVDKIEGFGDDVLGGLKDFFGIHSPSKLMAEEVGKWLPAGIAVGIDDNAKSVMSSMKDLAMNTVGGVRAGLNTATTTLGGGGAVAGGVVNNFTQVINSPKQLSRLDIYRQSKNLLGYAGGGV